MRPQDIVHVRFARPGEGPMIGRLALPQTRLDWTALDVEKGWLVAELDGAVVGCVQLLLGQPIGHAEWLGVEALLPHRTRARVAAALVQNAIAAIAASGAQAIICFVAFERKVFKKFLKKWVRAQVTASGNMLYLALPELQKQE